MITPQQSSSEGHVEAEPVRELPEAARRALAEAEARRAALAGQSGATPDELGGRGGLEPVRYGDWEVKGLASDF